MVSEAEQYAETDKACKQLVEEANKVDSICANTEKAINEFRDQIDTTEKVSKLIVELRELAIKGWAGDTSVNETQQSSLGLLQKVYEKRNVEGAALFQQPASENKEENE
ncbi:hypothetical protein BD309DRAFT_1059385 [Dichomitus squalens]|uniref:Uncharacterized protein n=1 Tax=Dichomitus squalens TaxID=114155 RepID=A0A4Q9NER9_9APHY|nr:hypothetical protein BD309DRAFT_1059385 [Dichomitus squalens]TBU51577.1 hypothetical protein BD310DRAFT_834041 [Dichomitus squalens]